MRGPYVACDAGDGHIGYPRTPPGGGTRSGSCSTAGSVPWRVETEGNALPSPEGGRPSSSSAFEERADDRDHIPHSDQEERSDEREDRAAEGSDFGFPGPDGSWWRRILPVVALGAIAMLFIGQLLSGGGDGATSLAYGEFVQRVEGGEVASVTIDNAGGSARGELETGTSFTTTVPDQLPQDLLSSLEANNVETSFNPPSDGNTFTVILANLLPLLLIGGLIWFFMRRARGQMSQLTGIRESQADVIDTDRPDTVFDDVAGYGQVKQEVQEVIDYLTDPRKYDEIGARGPGGLLMVGPPGTGKTLMARAVAGEAEVPFISAAGSEFVEMLVGVGASRVRDLFEKARENAPSIIFIDELDSLGRRRGGSTTIGSNNEQEQTLNQLLAEMDGFDPSEGVVVMAATNRAEMLDQALTRPGRFDRQIRMGPPKQSDRLEILRLHTRDKKLTDDVDLGKVARGTPGFSGAELENLTNEAAIIAVRHDRQEVAQQDFDEARDRVILGRREDSTVLTDDERQRVAVHESGHAIVAATREDADPVNKVTILPAGQALGVTEQLPLNERRLYPEGYLSARMDVAQGGRVAELLVLGEASSGAANDLSQATHIATRMVRDFGLSDQLGPVGYAQQQQSGDVPPALQERPFSEETQRALDEEVARILRGAEQRAHDALTEHRDALDRLIDRLLREDTVDGEYVYELVGREMPSNDPDELEIPPADGEDAEEAEPAAGRAASTEVGNGPGGIERGGDDGSDGGARR